MSEPAGQAPPAAAAPIKAVPEQLHPVKEFNLGRPTIGCRFDPLGRYVLAGAEDNLARRCDLASGKIVPLAGHDSWVRAFAGTPDGATLFTGGYDGRILWWPAAAEEPVAIRGIQAHQGWVRSLAMSPDGKLLASGGNDNLVKLWNVADGTLVRELPGHASHVYGVLFHPSGRFLVSGDLNAVLKQWDLASFVAVREIVAPSLHMHDLQFDCQVGGIRGLTFSPDGKLLACSGFARITNSFAGIGFPEVVSFDWESGKQKLQHQSKEPIQGPAWGVAFHPDGYWIGASGGQGGGHLYFWKPDGAQEFFRFKFADTLHDFCLHPDNLQLAAAHQDGRIRVYSMTPAPPAPKA